MWCNVLDLAAQNSWIIYKKINRKENKSKTVHTQAGREIEIAAHTSSKSNPHTTTNSFQKQPRIIYQQKEEVSWQEVHEGHYSHM